MKRKAPLTILVLLMLAVLGSSMAYGKDAIEASVSNATGNPIITVNGNPYSNGTYAVGTIQLWYTVSATQFTGGYFGSFDLNWKDVSGYSSGPPTTYGAGVGLQFTQIGGTDIILSPSPATVTVTAAGQSGTSTVTISINSAVPANASLNCDGCELVANLRLDTTPSGAHLDTVTNVQVHIKLVYPTACLRLYNFVMDQGLTGILSSISLNVPKNGANAGKVVSSNPGQTSDNILVVNTCSTDQSFDLGITLDPDFQTNPHNNPGNAVFTYSTSGATMEPATFDIVPFGTGTGQGQSLCLQNVTVPANTTFLATVHSQVISGTLATSLPGDGDFDFSATLYQVVNSGCTGTLDTMADPNPASFTLPYKIN
ncbi:MAG: hypothetical protein ACE14M_01000 [Terriglobales bacterium]